MRVRSRYALFAGLAIAAGVGGAFAFGTHTRAAHAEPPRDLKGATAYWRESIASQGGAAAYAAFAAAVAPLDANERHGLAHAFGEALYRELGMPGISVCDARFSYGCYHQLIGDAIAEKGLASVAQINIVCAQLPATVPCRHGVGHGLLGYLGYDAATLRRAIEECALIETGESLQGCYGGVFMEYNMRTLVGDGAVRPLAVDLQSPCDAFTGEAQQSCYLYQPQWWAASLYGSAASSTESFASMGELCEGLEGDKRHACFEGVGLMAAPLSGYRAAPSMERCTAAATRAADRTDCLIGDAVVFDGTDAIESAHAICGALPRTDEQACDAYLNGTMLL